MQLIRRILLLVIILALILGVVGFGGFFYLTRRPFPQVDGTLRANGLTTPVTIIRDKMGIPHIYASNVQDLFFAQGYVQAQDRLWQMDFFRRVGAGRLSELAPSQLGSDKFIRTLGWRRAAERDWEAMSDEGRMVLEAYTEGINAFIESNQGSLPIEYFVLGIFSGLGPPEAWTPVDSLQFGKVMAWNLSGNWNAELLRVALMEKFGPDDGPTVIADLLPAYAANRPVIVASDEIAWGNIPTSLLSQGHDLEAVVGISGSEVGSNSWVVHGERTTSGMPLLANDPHLGIGMPGIWYFNALHCVPLSAECPFEVIGASFVGLPSVVIGHNARIAWGVTNLGPDVQDLFIERIDGDQYEFQGEMLPIEFVSEVITVNGKLPDDYEPSPNETVEYDESSGETTVTLNVRITRHGPIISDVSAGAAELAEEGQAVAFQWTAINAPESTLEAFTRINLAQNWEEFRDALRLYGTPSQNFVYADVDGNIGYQSPGRIPIRASGNGLMPVPGWTGEFEWTGYIPFDDLPSALNPPKGYIVTANNEVVGEDYPYFLSARWASYRAQRLHDRLAGQQTFSVDDIMNIQGDNFNVSASEIVPHLNALSLEGDAQNLLDAIRAWDLKDQRDSVGAAAYETFFLYLLRNTFDDELGDLASEYVGGGDTNREVIRTLLDQPDARWWDDVNTTDVVESRDDILRRALSDAADALVAEFGSDAAGWTWGKLHTATFRHQALGSQIVGFMFNRGPVVVDGGQAIVNNTGGSLSRSYIDSDDPDASPPSLVQIFAESTVPSLRQIVNLADLNASQFIHTTGQSGLPYHPHYDDMIDLWRDIKYIPMWWNRDSIENDAEGTLTLSP